MLRQAEAFPTGESSISCAERAFSDEAEAANFFTQLERYLLDISHWNDKSDLSSYQLFEADGRPANDPTLKSQEFIRIRLAGSGKSDWVGIEDIYKADDELVITVRPTYDPTQDPQQTGKVSHFFWNEATNNFCAVRKNSNIAFYVIGLNEKENLGHTEGTFETIRNAAVANFGYYLGIQKIEWTKFCKSFLFEDQEKASG